MRRFWLLFFLFLTPFCVCFGLDCPTTPTPEPGWYVHVTPLPAQTTELNQTVQGSTGPYSNVYVRVTDMTTCAVADYFQWADYTFSIPIVLFPNTTNEVAVTACNDIWPPSCSTLSSENAEGLTVETSPLTTPTVTTWGALFVLSAMSWALLRTVRKR